MSSISSASAVSYQPPAAVPAKSSAPAPAPANDGDADDAATVAAKPAPGVGGNLDIKA